MVGKAWPHTLATQGNKSICFNNSRKQNTIEKFDLFIVEFGETVAAQCADHLKNNTRPLQLAIMNTLLKMTERLAFSQLYANHKQQLKYILSHVKRTLHFSFGK